MSKLALIVEDNDLIVRMYEAIFRTLGLRTVRASTSDAAFAAVASEQPSIIIMDCDLAAGSGIDVTRQLRQRRGFENVPIIAVTTHSTQKDEQILREAGCTHFVPKPFKVDALAALLRQLTA